MNNSRVLTDEVNRVVSERDVSVKSKILDSGKSKHRPKKKSVINELEEGKVVKMKKELNNLLFVKNGRNKTSMSSGGGKIKKESSRINKMFASEGFKKFL